MTKRRGRPAETDTAQRNADRVFLRLAKDRTLAKFSPELGPEKVKNPVSGKKLKGQHRSPRPLEKRLLPEVANEIEKDTGRSVSPRTLERHYAEHGAGAQERVVTELLSRLSAADKDRQRQLETLQRLHDSAVNREDWDRVREITAQIVQFRQRTT